MTTAVKLSKYIVNRAIKNNKPITNVSLQFILYLIQSEFHKQDKIAFYDAIEAWGFGPCVPNSYYYFCEFGGMPITIITKEDKIDIDKELVNKIVDSHLDYHCFCFPEKEEIYGESSVWKKYSDIKNPKQVIVL